MAGYWVTRRALGRDLLVVALLEQAGIRRTWDVERHGGGAHSSGGSRGRGPVGSSAAVSRVKPAETQLTDLSSVSRFARCGGSIKKVG